MTKKPRQSGRRHAQPAPQGAPDPALRALLQEAIQLHQAGRITQAIERYERILAVQPNHPQVLHVRGVAELQRNEPKAAIRLIQRSLGLQPDNAEANHNLGLAHLAVEDKARALEAFRRAVAIDPSNHQAQDNLGILLLDDAERLADAEATFRRALEAKPDAAATHSHLGLALKAQGRLDEALSALRRALALDPGCAPAHNGLAIVLNEQGKADEAVAALQRAIEIAPNYAAAHKNLGLILRDQGQHAESSEAFERALALDANDPDGYKNLGLGLRKLGRLGEAIEVFERGLSQAPDDAELHVNLGLLQQRAKDTDKAFRCFRRATELAPENLFYWQCFADSFRAASFKRFDDRVRRDLEQCLAIDGLSHRSYSDAVARFLRLAPEAEARIAAAKRGALKLSAAEVADGRVLQALGGSLLVQLMERTEIPDPDLEIMLTAVRRELLRLALEEPPADDIGDQALVFVCALAQQCFLNEYVYLQGDEEPAVVERLRLELERRLVSGGPVPKFAAAVFACYAPLFSLDHDAPLVAARRADAAAPFGRLVTQQIVEPRVEFEIMASLPSLAPVSDAVSRQVRAQYEENPYPRWLGLAEQTPRPVSVILGEIFPYLAAEERRFPEAPEFLIAGCGTGAQVIHCARRFAGAKIVAFDLSARSLAYGIRKARALGVEDVTWLQGDILDAANLERRFDVIECSGVLHHMRDPVEGWRVLLGLLKPDGFMKLGLYSELARQHIVAARAELATRSAASLEHRIRHYRHEVFARADDPLRRRLVSSKDFYALSSCRDLLCHVQEHRFTLPRIATILDDLGLEFLGFERSDKAAFDRYSERFPEDPERTRLDLWHQFEQDRPDTFRGMYQFWVRRRHAVAA